MTPCFFKAAAVIALLIAAYASAGISSVRIDALCSRSSKPCNRALGEKPGGGVRPMREPGGKTVSDAPADAAQSTGAQSRRARSAPIRASDAKYIVDPPFPKKCFMQFC